jgi:iron transport multicopper oxidase
MLLVSLLAFETFSRATAALQVLGPVTNLTISNAIIAPDGVSRGAVLAGGTFPGPLITAQSV